MDVDTVTAQRLISNEDGMLNNPRVVREETQSWRVTRKGATPDFVTAKAVKPDHPHKTPVHMNTFQFDKVGGMSRGDIFVSGLSPYSYHITFIYDIHD